MARHEITIPITKSSCSATNYRDGDGLFTPNPIGNILYMQTYYKSPTKYWRSMGMGWIIPEIIKKKNVVHATLYFYSLKSFRYAVGYKITDFDEGGNLHNILDSNDGVFDNGFSSGWNSIVIPGNDVIGVVVGQLDYTTNPNEVVSEVYSHRNSTNKPYVIVTYDDIAPDIPSSLYPDNLTLNPRDIIRFSWLHNSKENLQQKAFTLQYSTNGGSSWTTVNQITPNQYYDMPASTLPTSGTLTWRVMTTDNNDEVSGYTTSSFVLGVVPQKAPIPVSPISQYMDQTKVIKFEWLFVGGSSGETQSKYDLQYSTNGGTSWTTITNSNSNKYFELAANTLASGNITWRIRTYNNWNEVSPYSENRSFTVIGSPSIPLINNISNSARPTITWQSTGQHIYELQILKDNVVILDTGSIPSVSDKSYKLEEYLQDGNYIARLRIMNEYNLYSPWAEKSFTITTVKPSKPIMEVYNGEYGVTIKASNVSLKTYVYRDGELVGEVINNSFTDYTGENKKEYQYFVRTIDVNDNFNDSDTKLARCLFSDNTIALLDDPGKYIKLSYGLGSIPKKSNNFSVIGNLVYFDGRKNPITEFSEFEDESKTLGFFVKTQDEVDALKNLISKRKILLYRDYNGKNIIGTVLSIQDDNDILGYNIGFTITRCSI